VYVYGCTNAALDTHEQGYNITMTPNVEGSFDGILIRASDATVDGGQIVNCRRAGIRLGLASSNPSATVTTQVTVSGTTIANIADDGDLGTGILLRAPGAKINIVGATVRGFTYGVLEDSPANEIRIANCDIDGITAQANTQRGIWTKSGQITVLGTIVRNCFLGIDNSTVPTGGQFRFVTFEGCTTNANIRTLPSLAMADHEVPFGYFVSGRYYAAGNNGNVGTSAALGNDNLRVSPIYFRNSVTIDRIGLEVTVAGSAGALVRLGIYESNESGYPAARILDAGTIDGTVVAAHEITISQSLPPGVYWLGAVIQGSPATQPTIRVTTASSFSVGATSLTASLQAPVGYATASVAGGLPADFASASNAIAIAPRVAVRIA
jgi:hypothetical protein